MGGNGGGGGGIEGEGWMEDNVGGVCPTLTLHSSILL